MEVFAAYGAHVDYEVGRVLDAVAQLPDADNTMIIYIVGDKGSSAEGGFEGTINGNNVFNTLADTWQEGLKFIDELGGPKHFNHFPAQWAWAMNTPFQYAKAVADFDAALKINERQSASFYGRGLAKLKLGDKAGGEADLARARSLSAGIDTRFRVYGLTP